MHLVEDDRQGILETVAGTVIRAFAAARPVLTQVVQPILEIHSVQGLLQTADYAAQLIGNGPQGGDVQRIKRLVEVRLARQQVLAKEDAPQFRLLLNELVLHQTVGGPHVMQAQFKQILDTTGLPNVELRLIPIEPVTSPS